MRSLEKRLRAAAAGNKTFGANHHSRQPGMPPEYSLPFSRYRRM
jgi:hypothetical protein